MFLSPVLSTSCSVNRSLLVPRRALLVSLPCSIIDFSSRILHSWVWFSPFLVLPELITIHAGHPAVLTHCYVMYGLALPSDRPSVVITGCGEMSHVSLPVVTVLLPVGWWIGKSFLYMGAGALLRGVSVLLLCC